MRRDFGIDRPDLRNPLRLVDIADLMSAVDFKVFNGLNDPQGRVAALRAPGQQRSRGPLISTQVCWSLRARGLAYIKLTSGRRGQFAVTILVYSGRSDPCRAATSGREDGDIIFGAIRAKS